MNSKQHSIKKVDTWFPMFCGLLTYVLYELTNAPGLFWGDVGEFLAASCTLGIGHAYGHPLFWLVGRVSTIIYPGDPAAVMTHFTSLVSGATAWIVALLVRDWIRDQFRPMDRALIMFTVTGVYAAASTVWTQATFVEVYNFQAFFISLAIYFLNRHAVQKGHIANLFASAYFWGLSLTLGFYTTLILVLPIMMYWRVRSNITLSLKHLVISAFFVFVGCSVWIYLPVRSGVELTFYMQKIKTLTDFFHYLGREYYTHQQVAGIAGWMTSFSETLKIIMMNVGSWGIVLILLSIWSILTDKKNRLVIPYLLCFIFLIIFFTLFIPLNLTYRQMVDMDVYFVPAFIVLPPVLVVGAGKLVSLLKKPLRPLIILPVFLIVWSRWEKIDTSNKPMTIAFTQYLISNLPKGSIVIPVSDEILHPLLYHIHAKGNMEDYTLLKGKEVIFEDILEDRPLECTGLFIEINDYFLNQFFPQDDFFLSGPFIASEHDSTAAGRLEFMFRQKFSPENIDIDNLNRLDRLSLARMWARRGVYWFHEYLKAKRSGEEGQAYFHSAVEDFQRAFDLDNFSLEGALHASNLALSLIRVGDLEKAEYYAQQAIRLNDDAPEAHKAFYNIMFHRQDYERALFHLRKLTRLTPKDGEIYLNMAVVYYLKNQVLKARELYQKGIDLGAQDRDQLKSLLFN